MDRLQIPGYVDASDIYSDKYMEEMLTSVTVARDGIFAGRFLGQTIIVTGAGSGIGLATARRIAMEGGRVIAADLSRERLSVLAADNPTLDIVCVAGDITSEVCVAEIIELAGDRIDGLANVAGVMDDFSPIHEVEDEMWERIFAVNVTAIMRLSRAVIPLMLQAKSGAVVNISSEAGLRGSAGGAAYTAAKHAVIGLTKNSAVMYGLEGIRVNAVAPGSTMTNLQATWGSEIAAARLKPLIAANVPGAASADEIAASVAFLLSDESANINGSVLLSDGGWGAI